MNTLSKKILVTGAAGFLGSHLAEKLSAMNHKVVGIDNMIGGYKDNVPKNIEFHNFDCCDLNKMKEVMRNVDVVYHCAATAHEGLSVFSPVEITKNVYLASVSVFTAAINKKVKRLGLFYLLSQKKKVNSLFVVEDFKNEIKKTKLFNEFLEKYKLKNLLIISDKNSKSKIIKSARNIPNLKIIDQEGANAYDILKYKNVVFTTTSIKSFQDRLSK